VARTLNQESSTDAPEDRPLRTQDAEPGTRSRRDWYLLLVVFVSGAVSIGIELAASRLLAPFFGTSLFIWANLIGLTLIYLSVGYAVGGRIADRYPSETVLYTITTVAAFATGLIPLLSRPILAKSLTAFANLSLGGFYGSLAGTIILFAVPVTLLGCVSPFAIRLALRDVQGAGNTAGSLYALSTVGSIVGTFVPTFLLIPRIGTMRTFYTFSVVLLLASIVGLVRAPAHRWRRGMALLGTMFLIAMLLITAFGYRGFVRPVLEGNRTVIWQGESGYNFIQVLHDNDNGAVELYLNEGHAIHSLYFPNEASQPLTRGPWDFFAVAPLFANNQRLDQVRDVCVIGLAGGTAAQRMFDTYGANLHIDGVEIDPKIVDVARRFFAMNEPNLRVIVQDGRYYLRATDKRYDMIAVDAYHQPYIPFQLTTKEFFQEASDHLNSNGTFIVNAGRSATDYRLVEVISQTMRAVFPNVYLIDTPAFTNTMVIGTKQPTMIGNLATNLDVIRRAQPDSPLVKIGDAALVDGKVREAQPGPKVFTDDLAPVEDLIDRILLDYARKGGT
jgi:predicted membrane-bound spermidine synthase